MAFYKYPRTPHIGSASKVVDDDKVLPCAPFFRGLSDTALVVVQEKVDGANVGVHFEEEGGWPPVVQKRSGVIGHGEKRQYDVFRDWVYERADVLFEVLGTEYCLFGEWLWQQHAVAYSALPDYFLAFDVLEKSTGKFVCSERVAHMAAACSVQCVPTVKQWRGSDLNKRDEKGLAAALEELIATSEFGTERAEGVYVRVEDESYVCERVKYRRDTFTSGRDDFEYNCITNQLKAS
eukprot:TRINITY_DN5487_c0_g1_i1.p1 TRINITY_DN5487_c0_g1~~TRINITY_DN5487_c0_g1_i1.p1  ORF type:complete len:236 (-),score=77.51 TRINITY_DN5487_c0_g1_i1:401-1108(-)